jgi:hypothetical protein
MTDRAAGGGWSEWIATGSVTRGRLTASAAVGVGAADQAVTAGSSPGPVLPVANPMNRMKARKSTINQNFTKQMA